ncbi:hypothetical protein GBAR_LOCUS18224, partial [Geodia barretti]
LSPTSLQGNTETLFIKQETDECVSIAVEWILNTRVDCGSSNCGNATFGNNRQQCHLS